MKKMTFLYLVVCLVIANPAAGQKGLLNKVTKSAGNILGKPEKSDGTKTEPEPPCANDLATVAMDLGGKVKIDYQELTISILSDGRILAQHFGSDEYYVAKDGVTTGPFRKGDPQIADFVPKDEKDNSEAAFLARNKPYISKSGDKFLITFDGKKYGPYARIDNFTVSKSKDKFAAMATETVAITEAQGKDMEAALKNAKDDQERMELAMKYSQQMNEAVMKGGGPSSLTAKLVTNIPDASYDPMKIPNASLNGDIKYDDILMTTFDNRIYDLQSRVIFTLIPEARGVSDIFVSKDNTRYAFYKSGTLTFSDNTKMTDLFNPHLVKADGRVFISYMYYSPKNNAIMQHKIPF